MKISLMTNAHINVNGGELGGRNTDVNNDGSGNENEILEERETLKENNTEVLTGNGNDEQDGLININLSIQSTTSKISNLDTTSTNENFNKTTIIEESDNSNNSTKDANDDVSINSTNSSKEKIQSNVPLHHWDRAIHANEINRSVPNPQPMNPDVKKPSMTTPSVTIPRTLVSIDTKGKKILDFLTKVSR